MPGIAGIISRRPASECQLLVKAMVASMHHEPFYISGMHSVPEMGIHAGWVAHEKSLAANQVFFNEQKDIALFFSGECFADAETKTRLKQKGHHFSETAGDWLVHFYEERGGDFFAELNGLFSGLLIDRRQNKTFLFNDRYGVERIYWHETPEAFYFASEAKALLRVLPELRAFDEEGVAQFLAFGCTLEWRTLFQKIRLLPGGSLWSFENGNCLRKQYFSPETWQLQPALSEEDFHGQFQETFKRILPRYFECESRIGISLTAGFDTRMIMASLPHAAKTPVCFTFGGEKGETRDASLAAQVAKMCGLEHRLLRIGPDFFSNFASLADRTVYATDGCFGVAGAHEIYMNAQARGLSPVRLTGNYGSEVLRGISQFKPLGLSHGLLNPETDSTVSSVARQPVYLGEQPTSFAAFREIPWNLFGCLAAGRTQVIFRSPYLDNEMVALAYRAPESLRTHSPAMRFIRQNNPALSDVPTDMGKLGKKRGWAALPGRFYARGTFKLDYFINEGFPDWLAPMEPLLNQFNSWTGIFGRHKHLHYRNWFRRELAGYVNEVLRDAQTRRSLFWNFDFLKSMAGMHASGRKNYVLEINAVLTLETVERLLFRELPRGLAEPKGLETRNLSSIAAK